MTASNKEAFVQELFEEVKAQVEIIEKIMSRLSMMKEEELMKPTHDKEEGEEWDEEDKVGYERNKLNQEDVDRMMAEGKVYLLLPEFKLQLRNTHGPWTFKRAHISDLSKSGNAGSWEDHDWPKWTSIVRATQVTPTHFMLECDTDPSPDDDPFIVLA